MRVHVLLMRDQYDSALLGVFHDPEAGRSEAERRFRALTRSSWHRDPRGGEVCKVGSDGAYLWLGPSELEPAS